MCKFATPKGLRSSLRFAKDSRDLKDLILDEKFERFKDFVRAEHNLFNEIEPKHQRALFLFEFLVQGEFPKVIYAEEYLYNDSGALEATEGVFSVKEVEELTNVSDEVFNRFKAFGVEKIEEYLKEVLRWM